MKAPTGKKGPVQIGDLTGDILDPVLRKRAGLSSALLQSWEEIVGPSIAARSRPEKVSWPRRATDDDPFEPATLVVACEGAAAMRIQHETSEIMGRINGFMGFEAIGRIRIVQKTVSAPPPPRPKLRPLRPGEERKVAETAAGIEDDGLRAALERLGRSVLARRS